MSDQEGCFNIFYVSYIHLFKKYLLNPSMQCAKSYYGYRENQSWILP